MRKAFGSLVFILLLVLSMGASIQVHGEEASPLVKARREVEVREGGSIVINDTFILSNPPNVTSIDVESFFMGFPSDFADYIDYHAFCQWHNNTWIALAGLEAEENGTRGFRVTLTNPVRLEGNETLTLRGVFLFSETVYPYSNGMIAAFPLYPSLALNISNCDVEVRLPKGAILTSADPGVFSNSSIEGTYILSHNQSSLPPFQMAGATVAYMAGTSSNLLVRCEWLQRVIDLKPPSQMTVRDTFSLLNRGSQLYFYQARVPLDSFGIDTRDYLGHLTFFSERFEEEGYIKVSVIPRIATGIRTGERWTFTIEYSLPLKEYVDKGEGDGFYLNYLFLPDFNFTVRHLEVIVDLPEGGEYQTSMPTFGTVRNVGPFTQEVSYNRENATVLDDLSFHLAYAYNYLWTSFRPTLWSSFLALAMVGTYQLLRLKKKKEGKISEDRLPIRRFIELYEEKLTLSAEDEKLEEDMADRRISRSEYNKRKETAESGISRVEGLLKGVKDRIKKETPRFEGVLREIEVAEVEVETERTNLRELEVRLRGRRISRDAYRRLREEYLRRIRRARARIERAILSLREEVY